MLKEAGVLLGADMTPEAALTKLSYLLGRTDYSKDKRKMVKCYLCLDACYNSSAVLWWYRTVCILHNCEHNCCS